MSRSSDEHAPRRAGLLSQKLVSEGNREAWLELLARDGQLTDPVNRFRPTPARAPTARPRAP